ncbi:VWA domain-containing protein [Tenacibaculum aiptasiae]|uniref:VWA domain-containing protein n=1 Tax=Tenacibaculum aiptasiae TaxID=426481 RepID=A0A7J5AAU1_9FLAO|nr:VWA domain-containing protein [Tenacibaculum aiptasiae]KAB1154691.1 VWA domain-containing protein [Tenacibaculum aiptasiae]
MRIISLLLTILLCCFSSFAQQKEKQNQALLANTLNVHIDYLNFIAKKNGYGRKLLNYLTFNQRFNEKVTKSYKSSIEKSSKYQLKTPRFNKPAKMFSYDLKKKESLLEKVRSLQENIPITDRYKVITLFDSIKNNIENFAVIHKNIYDLTKDAPVIANNQKIINSVYLNLTKLDNAEELIRKLNYEFENLVHNVYRKHFPVTSNNNSWLLSAKEMEMAIDTARVYLKKIRAQEISSTKLVDTVGLSKLLNQLKSNRNKNLQGIHPYTYETVHSIHDDYDMFGSVLRKFIKGISCSSCLSNKKTKKRDISRLYNYAYYDLNSAVTYYNNFANSSSETKYMKVTPQFLLHKIIDFGWYDMEPQPNQPMPTIENLFIESYAFNHTVLLLDVSRSMNHYTKLPLIKNSIKQLSLHLRKNDRLSVVIYSNDAKAIMTNVSFTDSKSIALLEKLSSNGKTNAAKGLDLALEIGRSKFIANGNNRIILATDGDFALTPKSFDQVKQGAKENIVLSVFGFGKRVANEKQLKKLAEVGAGHYQKITIKNSLEAIIKELTAVKRKDL